MKSCARWSALGLKIQNSPASVLQGYKASVQGGALLVELVASLAQPTHLGHQSGVVVEDPRNRVRTLATWGVEFGDFDDMGFEFDSAAHNQRYIKSRRDR